jgi:murein DD-endopeptidase MepM/ murein hydrolase activator NlpD
MMRYQICSLWLVLLFVFAPLAPAGASSNPPTDQMAVYIVHKGDTLYNIATRHHINAATLAQWNGLANPNMIYVGQRLIVPAEAIPATATPAPVGDKPIFHIVQPGETMFRIALKHGTTVWAIVSANQLENPSFIYAGQQLVIPTGDAALPSAPPETGELPAPFLDVQTPTQPVVQGRMLVVAVRAVAPVVLQGSFLDGIIPFANENGVYYALIGVHAMQKVGGYPLTITATDAQGRQSAVLRNIKIAAGKYGVETINLPPDKQKLLDPVLTQAEREKLWSVFSIFRPERYWQGKFRLPVQGKISSVFGTRRHYIGGPFNNYHEGIDFSANSGTPVYAPADGIVALAEPLVVRGNAVILDHGWGVHSGFYHLSRIEVTVGQKVKAGEVVGRVGSTGLSTGAHLHWDMRVRGLNVDPQEWTGQAFP